MKRSSNFDLFVLQNVEIILDRLFFLNKTFFMKLLSPVTLEDDFFSYGII